MIREIAYHVSLSTMKVAWWCRALLARSRGHTVPGVRVVVLNEDRAVLVRHWYAPYVWTLPGGGINKNETAEAAAVREVYEETGLPIHDLIKLGSYEEGRGVGSVFVYAAHTTLPLPGIKNIEIMQAKYWGVSALPKNIHPRAKECVENFQTKFR